MSSPPKAVYWMRSSLTKLGMKKPPKRPIYSPPASVQSLRLSKFELRLLRRCYSGSLDWSRLVNRNLRI